MSRCAKCRYFYRGRYTITNEASKAFKASGLRIAAGTRKTFGCKAPIPQMGRVLEGGKYCRQFKPNNKGE